MSTIKVNKIEKRTGSTLTLGGACTAVTLACGATQTGFGRTGTVDWCTTAKTSPFTAVNGKGYFINTTSGGVTVTLPSSPSAGDIVSFKDYANTFDTNAVTIGRNGSKINGVCQNSSLDTESQSVTLIYVDGTKGWQSIQDGTSNVTGATFIAATGGTVTTSGDFKIHTFTSSGCFQVTSVGNAAGSNKVSYMVVAGGGGGGGTCRSSSGYGAGGGGAGGYREGKCTSDPYTASPLNAPAGLPVSVQTYPITIGAGGSGGAEATPGTAGQGGDGGNSIFSSITSTGGGGGGAFDNSPTPVNIGRDGGSGGGAGSGGHPGNTPFAGGSGNTPPVSPPQGNPGATMPGSNQHGTGGGGATAAGSSSPACLTNADGGAGATTSINASPVARAGGGGGHRGAGGAGGGGDGADSGTHAASAGTTNTGGGGGGSGYTVGHATGGAGGSGIIIIRYKFQ